MKNAIRFILVFSCLLLAQSSCIQNGGNIGKIFGKWVVIRIEGDNMDPPSQDGDLYFSFQKDVLKVQRDKGHHDIAEIFGSFRMEDDKLYLSFPEEDQPPFVQTGLDRNSELQILKLTGREMELRYAVSSDKSLIYFLRKW